jgi:hypothetical protein
MRKILPNSWNYGFPYRRPLNILKGWMCDCSACHDKGSGALTLFPFHTSWDLSCIIQNISNLSIVWIFL